MLKDAATSGLPAEGRKKRKKDDVAVPKKSSARKLYLDELITAT